VKIITESLILLIKPFAVDSLLSLSSLDDLIYLTNYGFALKTMVCFEGDIAGLATHVDRVVKRGSDPWAVFPVGDEALVQWTSCCPFISFNDDIDDFRRVKASVLFQSTSCTKEDQLVLTVLMPHGRAQQPATATVL